MSDKNIMAHIEGQKIGDCVSLRRVYPDGTVQCLVIPISQLGTLVDWCLDWLDEDPDPDDPDDGKSQSSRLSFAEHLQSVQDLADFILLRRAA